MANINKVQMYSVCEMIVDEDHKLIECEPVTLCLTNNRLKLFDFLDNYILDDIALTDKLDNEDEEYTKISITVDPQWWKNLNNKTWPIELDNYPSCIIIKHTFSDINNSSYIVLYISQSYIQFL